MMKNFWQAAGGLALASAFLLSSPANAQLAANTYQFSAISGTYTPIVGGTSVTSIQADDVLSGILPIGFTFNYCGTDYTQLKASSNGWLTFSTTVTSSSASNLASEAQANKPVLMPLYDDINGNAGTATYLTEGTAPNRIYTLQYSMWRWNWSSSFPPTISFQVKLYESTNIIQFIYNQEAGTGNASGSGGATIGIGDNSTAPFGYLTLNNTTTAPTASSTTFTTTLSTRPASGQVYQFKPLPAIDMRADSVTVPLPFCSNSSQPASVYVSNQGTATIDSFQVFWSVDGVAQTPVTYSGTPISGVGAAPANTASVTLGNVFFPDNTPRVIKAYIYQPNSLPDADNTNDTTVASKAANLTGVIVHIAPQDTTICNGTSLILDAGSDHPTNPVYVWNNGQVTPSITVTQAGTYSVFVQNADGCFDRDTVTISVHPLPLVNSIAIIDNGDGSYSFNVIGAQNIISYHWDFGDDNIQDGTGIPGQVIHTFLSAGQYVVTLTLTNDCGSITVTKPISNTPTSNNGTAVENVSALQKAIAIYPNPSKTSVTIDATDNVKMQSISVYNVIGQKVMGFAALKTAHYQLNLSGLSSGLYNVMIDTDAGTVSKKLEVAH